MVNPYQTCYGYTMNKPQSTQAGTITLANGTTHDAWQNTYRTQKFTADGTSAFWVEETRIEFLLDTNAAYQVGRKYRKATAKQAATFVPDQG